MTNIFFEDVDESETTPTSDEKEDVSKPNTAPLPIQDTKTIESLKKPNNPVNPPKQDIQKILSKKSAPKTIAKGVSINPRSENFSWTYYLGIVTILAILIVFPFVFTNGFFSQSGGGYNTRTTTTNSTFTATSELTGTLSYITFSYATLSANHTVVIVPIATTNGVTITTTTETTTVVVWVNSTFTTTCTFTPC